MKHLLVTGFEVFGDHGQNPSELLLVLLPDIITVDGHVLEIRKKVLPVSYAAVDEFYCERRD